MYICSVVVVLLIVFSTHLLMCSFHPGIKSLLSSPVGCHAGKKKKKSSALTLAPFDPGSPGGP